MFKAYHSRGHADLLENTNTLDRHARESGLVRRTSKHFSAAAFLISMMHAVAGNTPQLRNLAARIALWAGRSLSKQALSKRFSEVSSAYLLRIVSDLLRRGRAAPSRELLARFNRVVIEDSTQLAFHKRMAGEFPAHGNQLGATAACKIDFIFDLSSHRAMAATLWPATAQDKEIGPDALGLLAAGDLILRDMGYFSIPSFAAFDERGVFWISRLPANVVVAGATGKPLEKLLEKHEGCRLDLPVRIGKASHECRLVAVRAERAVAARRRRELHAAARRRGRAASKSSLVRAGWHILLTNLPEETAGAEDLCRLYGLRWRIETLFRSWKRDKQWTASLRHVSNRWHLEGLVLAGLIQGLLAMEMVLVMERAGKLMRVSLEKLADTLRQQVLLMTPKSCRIELPERIHGHMMLEQRKRKSTLNQMLTVLS